MQEKLIQDLIASTQELLCNLIDAGEHLDSEGKLLPDVQAVLETLTAYKMGVVCK